VIRGFHARCMPAFAALVFCLLAVAPLASAPAPEVVVWLPVKDALLEIDSKPAKLWTLYYVKKDRKEQRFMLQIGSRYLMIDTQLRLITEFDSKEFTRKGVNYEMPREARGRIVLPSQDWVLRDVGTAFLIQIKLKEEGRMIQIELPKWPDFRNVLW